ncbi:MAG TPA: glyceraldehyde 3-phosphate dehydrogenase NAD-binding domain-containing protein [Candidatus Paceibacterota bacterium]|nr:glyceraldehyde 3-phosphate dehydrogenase NAD-binding domain-containing protein [Candidatus Paceibacterota bacterium]
MKKVRVAINGFGRIGRAFFRVAFERGDIEIVAINDLGDLANLAYLLKYDSVYRTYNHDVSHNEKGLLVDGKHVASFAEKEPSALPWGELNIDVVVESTGFFTSYEGASAHIKAGAKKAVITAPAKGEPLADIASGTVLMGINEEALNTCIITSNASCTTNAASPLIAILDETIGIEKAILNTVHGYTATQALVDSPAGKKGFREGRAAAANIVPSSTGAAIAVTRAFPRLEGLFDGVAMRVPVIAGSIVDVTFIAKRDTSIEEVNQALKQAAGEARWQKVFSVTEDELVSSDILGSRYASVADLQFTRVVGGNLVKVLAWYDNEMGYTHALIEHVVTAGNNLHE